MKILLFAAITSLPGIAAANASPVKARVVAEHESMPGETLQQFLTRYAVFLDGWTGYNGVEACGAIARQGDAYSIITQTIDSQVECHSSAIYSGWEWTGETIHSHPRPDAQGRIYINDKTREVSGALIADREYVVVQRHAFSAGDYASGCGYLVDDGVLLYQCGDGTGRMVASIR